MSFHTRASSEFSTESQSSHPNEENEENEGIDGPKRKGGRKPKFTAAARKQRNRDAQAAFRERRIEYIKELEETVKLYGDKLRAIEASSSGTTNECLMLRYKNSLLEKILLHKGIDVNLELDSKSWMTHPNPNLVPTPAIELKRRRLAQPRSKTGWLTRDAISSSKIDHVPRNSAFSRTPPPSSTSPGPKPAKQQKSFHTVTKDPKLSDRRRDDRRTFDPKPPLDPETAEPLHRPDSANLDNSSVDTLFDIDDVPNFGASLEDFDFSLDFPMAAPMVS